MTKFRNTMLSLGMATLVAGAMLSPVPSHAAQINALFTPLTTNTIEDTDAERVLRGGEVITTGQFQTGDIIQSILRFNTASAQTISDVLPNPYQLTGISELRITSIDDLGGGNVQLHFGASGNLSTASAMVDLYERTSAAQPSFSLTSDPATAIADIMGQTYIAGLGLSGNDFWRALTENNIGDIALGTGQLPAGVFGISVLDNPGGLPIVPDGILSPITANPLTTGDGNFHDVVGSADIFALSAGVNSGWLVSSNIDASFTVPEPGTLALFGLSLLGLCLFLGSRA